MASSAQNDGGDPQPILGNRGASILGPRNIPLERENPDQLASPYTDSGTIPNLKFSFAGARNRLLSVFRAPALHLFGATARCDGRRHRPVGGRHRAPDL